MRRRIDRDQVITGLLSDDPELISRYHNSATFRQGVDSWVDMAASYLQGLAERSDEIDAELAERARLLERDMFRGTLPDDRSRS